MDIQNYQIHNVLNVYRKQLSQGSAAPSRQGGSQHAPPDPVTISLESKNQAVLEKVAATVFKKLTRVAPGSTFESKMAQQGPQTDHGWRRKMKERAFTFNTIVENNQKETRSIAIDNSQVWMNRLNELAKATVRRETEQMVKKPADLR